MTKLMRHWLAQSLRVHDIVSVDTNMEDGGLSTLFFQVLGFGGATAADQGLRTGG